MNWSNFFKKQNIVQEGLSFPITSVSQDVLFLKSALSTLKRINTMISVQKHILQETPNTSGHTGLDVSPAED